MVIDNMRIIHIISIIVIILHSLRQVRRHIVHTLVGGGGQHGGFDALDYRKIRHGNAGKLGTYDMTFSQFCLTNLQGFCLSFMLIDLKASTFRTYPQTEVTLMCTEHFLMIRYKTNDILKNTYTLIWKSLLCLLNLL